MIRNVHGNRWESTRRWLLRWSLWQLPPIGEKRVLEQFLHSVRLALDAVQHHAADNLTINTAIFDRIDTPGIGRRKDLISGLTDW